MSLSVYHCKWELWSQLSVAAEDWYKVTGVPIVVVVVDPGIGGGCNVPHGMLPHPQRPHIYLQ